MFAVEDVQEYLRAVDLVDGVTGWLSVRRRVHDDADRLVVISEDGGAPPEARSDEIASGDAAFAFPQVQVRVRAEPWEADVAALKMREIRDALHGQFGLVMNGTLYQRTVALSEPVLFYDDRKRPNFTLSFALTRDEEATFVSPGS